MNEKKVGIPIVYLKWERFCTKKGALLIEMKY